MDIADTCRSALALAARSKANTPEQLHRLAALLCNAIDVLQAQSDGSALTEGILGQYAQCQELIMKMVQNSDAAKQLTGLRCLEYQQHRCPRAQFLAALPDVLPRLGALLRSDDLAVVRATCSCTSAVLKRLSLSLAAPQVRMPAAHALSKLVAAVLHILTKPGPAARKHEAWTLLSGIQGCMPQALKAHTAILGTEAAALLVSPALLSHRLAAARCLARLPASAASSEVWSEHCRGIVSVLHRAFDVLPMPRRDADLSQAAAELLQSAQVPLAAPWAALTLPPIAASLQPTLDAIMLLLEVLDRLLSLPSAAPCPLPTSAIVLLVTRMLSLQRSLGAAGAATLADPGMRCQLQAAVGPLVSAGTPSLPPSSTGSDDTLMSFVVHSALEHVLTLGRAWSWCDAIASPPVQSNLFWTF